MPSEVTHRHLIYGNDDPQRQVIDVFFPDTLDLVSEGRTEWVLDAIWHNKKNESMTSEHAVPSKRSKGTKPALLVFVHGGAWVSEENKDHFDLAQFIAGHSDTVVALIDYRLSSKALAPSDGSTCTETTLEKMSDPDNSTSSVRHPDHISDVFQGLQLLLRPETADRLGYTPNGAVLAGHSVGGYMTLATALDCQNAASSPDEQSAGIADFPPIAPHVRSSIKAYVCAESIFSLVELLREYPDYGSFVVPAFYPAGLQPEPPFRELHKAGVECWPRVEEEGFFYNGADDPNIFIFHSADDTLLSTSYNRHGIGLLRHKGLELYTDHESFRGDHDDIVHCDAFWLRLIDILHGHKGF